MPPLLRAIRLTTWIKRPRFDLTGAWSLRCGLLCTWTASFHCMSRLLRQKVRGPMKHALPTLAFLVCLSPVAALPFVADRSRAYSDRYLDPRMYVAPYGAPGPGPTAPPLGDDYWIGYGWNLPPISFGPRGSNIAAGSSNRVINGRSESRK
jgi:hypothetical protein